MLDAKFRASQRMWMRFSHRLQDGAFAVALEITPPQKALHKVLVRRARLLGEYPQAINVIQRPGRQSSLEASLELLDEGMEPAWHLVTRARGRADILAELELARSGGIEQVLCILGDHRAVTPAPDSPSIREVVSMARDALPGALIGATLNQTAPDRDAVLRNLLPKLRAGASYVQTQPVFSPEALEPFAVAIDRELPETRIIAMAMPLLSLEAGERIEERLGVRLPDALREVLATGDEDAAWRAFSHTLEALVRAPYVDGVAIMTFEMDAPPETGQRIVDALYQAGAIDSPTT